MAAMWLHMPVLQTDLAGSAYNNPAKCSRHMARSRNKLLLSTSAAYYRCACTHHGATVACGNAIASHEDRCLSQSAYQTQGPAASIAAAKLHSPI